MTYWEVCKAAPQLASAGGGLCCCCCSVTVCWLVESGHVTRSFSELNCLDFSASAFSNCRFLSKYKYIHHQTHKSARQSLIFDDHLISEAWYCPNGTKKKLENWSEMGNNARTEARKWDARTEPDIDRKYQYRQHEYSFLIKKLR